MRFRYIELEIEVLIEEKICIAIYFNEYIYLYK